MLTDSSKYGRKTTTKKKKKKKTQTKTTNDKNAISSFYFDLFYTLTETSFVKGLCPFK